MDHNLLKINHKRNVNRERRPHGVHEETEPHSKLAIWRGRVWIISENFVRLDLVTVGHLGWELTHHGLGIRSWTDADVVASEPARTPISLPLAGVTKTTAKSFESGVAPWDMDRGLIDLANAIRHDYRTSKVGSRGNARNVQANWHQRSSAAFGISRNRSLGHAPWLRCSECVHYADRRHRRSFQQLGCAEFKLRKCHP